MVKSIESSRIEEKYMQYQHIKRRQMLGAVPCLMLAGLPAIAQAQASFPSRPLRVIVPQPPGGGFDFVARTLGERRTSWYCRQLQLHLNGTQRSALKFFA